MDVVFDNSSESFQSFIMLLFSYRWLDVDERRKLTALAPFMTEEERDLISASLHRESQMVAEQSKS